MTSLGSLPDDLFLDIVEHLDTARDVAHIAGLSRRTNRLVQHDGWKSFIKARLASHYSPTDQATTNWSDTASRLTYLDRCWHKRGLSLIFFGEKQAKGRGQQRQRGRQSVLYHSVLDAQLLSPSQDELLVWGAGENLVIRLRSRGGLRDTWSQLKGHHAGYSAGTGDITSLSTIQRLDLPEIVIGRANGDLQLLAATADGSDQLPAQALVPVEEDDLNHRTPSMRKSPGQLAVSWLEWQSQSHMLASCKSSVLTLYDLSQTQDGDLRPVTFYDVAQDSPADETSLMRSAKFMGADAIACALGGSREPLRWSKLRPTGLEFVNAAYNSDPLDRVATKTEVVAKGAKTSVRAIEPVGNGGSVLLSAWDDGTHRLIDLRTPSAHDAVYRDRFQPYQASSSLLVYGTERFVAGNNSAPNIRLFDFRSPKSYHHSTALPCSAQSPSPARSYYRETPAEAMGLDEGSAASVCDPWTGRLCNWHAKSQSDAWRPDATLHFGDAAYDRISFLTKASDTSESFYCGVRGAVVEASWQLSEDVTPKGLQRTAPPGWTASEGSGTSLMETGVSLCSSEEWMEEFNGVPKLFHQRYPPNPPSASRLDSAFRVAGT